MAGTKHSPKTGRFIPGKAGGGSTVGKIEEYNPKTGPSSTQKIANAEVMYGTGSKQHKEAIKRFRK